MVLPIAEQQRCEQKRKPGRPRLELSLLPLKELCPSPARSVENDVPTFLEGYELGSVLGSGTTAVVKRATCRTTRQQVAVKCMKTSDEELQMFARTEYEILSKLSHTSIIAVEAFHCDSNHVWIVMELCDGNVDQYCQSNGRFSQPHTLSLFKQLLGAVDYMHAKRIVHRDLKPENCLLKEDATILKVTDFNSAKEIGQGHGCSVMLSFRGTHAFSAPELLLGQDWNERVDVWNSGMVLYFMLCGKVPFNCGSRRVKERFAEGQHPEVDWHKLGPAVRLLALQCLAIDMRNRPAPMKLLKNALFHEEGNDACQCQTCDSGRTLNRLFLVVCECTTRSRPRALSVPNLHHL